MLVPAGIERFWLAVAHCDPIGSGKHETGGNINCRSVPIQMLIPIKNRLRLDEDGLALWAISLRNASSILPTTPNAPSLASLLPGAIQLLGENLDLLGTILSIVESYLLLDAAHVLKVRSPLSTAVRTDAGSSLQQRDCITHSCRA